MTHKREIPGQITGDQGLRNLDTKQETTEHSIVASDDFVKQNVDAPTTNLRQQSSQSVHISDETEAFLSLFGGKEHLFRVFPDKDEDKTKEKAPKLTKTFKKQTFSSVQAELMAYNSKGSGIFFTVNEATGPADADVISISAVFLDLDGSPLDNIEAATIRPHAIIQTSDGRWHVYWLVYGISVNEFKAYQQEIARIYGGDSTISNPGRVMRLPGFNHMKHEPPFLSTIVEINPDLPYSPAEIIAGLGLNKDKMFSSDNQKTTPKAGSLTDGERNETVKNYCFAIRKSEGLSGEALFERTMAYNNDKCAKPLPASEIRKMCKHTEKTPPSLLIQALQSGNVEDARQLVEEEEAQPKPSKRTKFQKADLTFSSTNWTLFLDQDRDLWVEVGKEKIQATSERLLSLFSAKVKAIWNDGLPRDTAEQVFRAYRGPLEERNEIRELFYRSAQKGAKILIDSGRTDWSCYEISADVKAGEKLYRCGGAIVYHLGPKEEVLLDPSSCFNRICVSVLSILV